MIGSLLELKLWLPVLTIEKNNKIEVEFRLWDVVSETDMIGLRLTVDKASWRRVSILFLMLHLKG